MITKLEIDIIRDLVDNSEDSYYHFFINFWDTICPEDLVENKHIKYLCGELQKVGDRVIKRLPKLHDYYIINISPGESKSSIVSQLFPVWLWVKDPSIRVLTASYSSRAYQENAEKSRDCILSQKFQLCFGDRVQLRQDSKAKFNYKTTEGGQRYSTSPKGAATGIHCHIHVLDDLLNAKEAASDASLEVAKNFQFNTLASRTVDNKIVPCIVVMQRLHEEDTTGQILKKVEKGEATAHHIKLPATNEYEILPPEAEELIYTDGIMNPHRRPMSELENIKKKLGAKEYAQQYGQSTVPAEGNIIKYKWFKRCTYAFLHNYAEKHNEIITWNFEGDTAYTEKEENDPTGIGSYCIINGKLFIRNFEKFRKEIMDCVEEITNFVDENGYNEPDPTSDYKTLSSIFLEPKASGMPIAQVFQKTLEDYTVILNDAPKFSKTIRLKAKANYIRGGNVYLIEGPYIDDFLLHVCGFPNMKHDEEVDVLVQMIDKVDNDDTWGGQSSFD